MENKSVLNELKMGRNKLSIGGTGFEGLTPNLKNTPLPLKNIIRRSIQILHQPTFNTVPVQHVLK
jgi:hypothetical protein